MVEGAPRQDNYKDRQKGLYDRISLGLTSIDALNRITNPKRKAVIDGVSCVYAAQDSGQLRRVVSQHVNDFEAKYGKAPVEEEAVRVFESEKPIVYEDHLNIIPGGKKEIHVARHLLGQIQTLTESDRGEFSRVQRRVAVLLPQFLYAEKGQQPTNLVDKSSRSNFKADMELVEKLSVIARDMVAPKDQDPQEKNEDKSRPQRIYPVNTKSYNPEEVKELTARIDEVIEENDKVISKLTA